MKRSRKDPLREKHSFFCFFCFVDFQMKKKPRQTLAGSVRVCYRFCWWLGTGSQGTRRHRSFQLACVALTHCENKSSLSAGGVTNDSTDIRCTAQHRAAATPAAWNALRGLGGSLLEGWGQRMVSLHSRLCSEVGESRGLEEVLVVCGRRLFGRRMDGDELRAPQLCRWRSSCSCFLGLPVMRWVIICTVENGWKKDTSWVTSEKT